MNIDEMLELDFWEMILRTTITFIALLILARIMGKKQISQLTFFHYVTGITIGSIAGNIAGESETPFLNGLVSMIWWALLTLLMSFIALKSRKARLVLDDQPTIVMREGKILEGSLKKLRLHLNDLNMMLREQGVFSIKDVNYAVLETNGKLSILKKVGQEPATKQDVKAPAPIPKYIPSEIISDGKIVEKNLPELNLTEEWVYEQLKKQGIGKVEHVFYAEIQTDGSLHVDMKSEEDQ
ncbi:YetF domain-containing protein [Sporosarcina limicola]|uniref:Uncharacterized membrane protein YcaP (DUF421 family) n=1 Tax=Sporosarcina limicola TaxID=34101 RepID=A0A927MI41_9BACL|nr:DUF421 domain-containing protein [Sporosarcina limicola]MBE1554211.1 uncharacterized membrane protein YcaP (DUF421 family) [Sporosarcina limicola]